MSLTALPLSSQAQSVSGIVALEGCAAPAQSVTFAFSSATKSYFFTRTVTLNANGSYTLPNLPADTYHVKIKGPKWLAAVSDVTVGTGTATLNASLNTGDANDDNACDATDFGLLVSAYNSSASVPGSGYDPNCDLTCDGFVDANDLGLLVGDYDSVGAELPAGTASPLARTLGVLPEACLVYADAVEDTYLALTGGQTLGYLSEKSETVRFEDDFTPNSMQTSLVLATRNAAHVCIYNAPSAVSPATVAVAPGTVMYDATFTPAPSGPSSDPYNAIANCLHTLNVTLTAGTTYHIVIDFDDTTSFEMAPDYAASYGFARYRVNGFNGITLFPLCAVPAAFCIWDPSPAIQTDGIASVSSGSQTWTRGGQVPQYPLISVTPNAVVIFTAATASDKDTMTTVDPVTGATSVKEDDTVSYFWQASGGVPFGFGKTFSWNAPGIPGTYTVNLTVNDGAPDPAPCRGSRDDDPVSSSTDLTKVFNFTVIVCADAHPTNFRLDPNRTPQEITAIPFGLRLNYVWDSSDGNLAHLAMCHIRENVVISGDGSPAIDPSGQTGFMPDSPPFASQVIPNPTISPEDINGALGTWGDSIDAAMPVKLYRAASYTGTQYWEFHCDGCMQPGEWQRLAGPFTITRTIYQSPPNSGDWWATVTDNGFSSSLPLGRN